MGTEAYIRFRKLTTREDEPVKDIIQRGIGHLQGLKEKAILQLRVTGTPSARAETYSIALTPSGAHLLPDNFAKPTLLAILSYESFHRIASGSYSPLQAYLDQDLKVIGKVDVGKNILTQLAGSGTQVGVCPILVSESWLLDGPGFGHITFTGDFFTPFGMVDIVYNWGGGFYQQILTADSGGSFTTTQNNLFCGDIPGQPGVGVIVTATDLASDKSTTANYATPC